MNGERQLTAWLERWAEASEQIERAPGETCLTAEEIAAFVDDKLEAPLRRRTGEHLSQCSYCAREVGSLLRATRDFDDRMRVNRALGRMAHRMGACVRVFVDQARGAFTRADGLLQGLAVPARLEPAFASAGLGLVGLRSMDDGEEEESDGDPDALHEVALRSEHLPGVELLCGEEDGGSVTVSLMEPWEVLLVTPDGATQILEVEPGDDRYYATATGMPPGPYFVTLLRPEVGRPNPP